MELKLTEEANVIILSMDGNLLGVNDSKPILEIVQKAINGGKPNFIFQVEKLKYLNSTGLSILINTLTKARKSGGEMYLVKTQDQLQSLLEITKLDAVFPKCDSVEEAKEKINAK